MSDSKGLSLEMSEEVNICVDRLKQGVLNMDSEKLDMTRKKYGHASQDINHLLGGMRGLASWLAGQAAIAREEYTFSDQIDGQIRFDVIDMVKSQNLSVQEMREVNEHVIDYMM